MQQIPAATVINALGTTQTIPPAQSTAGGRWYRPWQLIQTRVTGIKYAAVMATLQNDTGVPIFDLATRIKGLLRKSQTLGRLGCH